MKNEKEIEQYLATQKVLSGKWAIYILYLLSKEHIIRYSDLKKQMPEEISRAVLKRQLTSLENDGLVIRTEYYQIPPRVEYSLTELGQMFQKCLKEMGRWGKIYLESKNEK